MPYLVAHSLDKGDFEGAVQAFKESIRLLPTYESHSELGRALKCLGDTAESLLATKEAIRLASGSKEAASAWCDYAITLHESGDIDGAIRASRRCIELKHDESNYHYCLSRFLRDSGDSQGQIKSLRVAISLDPLAVRPLISLACAEGRRGKKAEAMTLWERATQAARKGGDQECVAECLSGYGEACTEMGKHHKARLALEEATRLHPDKAMYHHELAGTLHTFSQMLPMKSPADCDWPEFYNLLLTLRHNPKDFPDAVVDTKRSLSMSAIESLRTALRLEPDNLSIHYELARQLSMWVSNRREALEVCKAGLALNPKHVYYSYIKRLRDEMLDPKSRLYVNWKPQK